MIRIKDKLAVHSFMLRKMIQASPFWLPVSIGGILATSALSLWQLTIPKILISSLEEKPMASEFFKTVLLVGLVTVILHIATAFLEKKHEMMISIARTGGFRTMLIRKLLRIRYSNLQDAVVRDTCSKAWRMTWSNRFGVEGYLRKFKAFFTAVVTLLLLSGTLMSVHPLLPVLLIVFAVADSFVTKKEAQLGLSFQKENTNLDERMEYAHEVLQDTAYGKEIRLMKMGDYLRSWYEKLMAQKNILFDKEQKVGKKYAWFHIGVSLLRNVVVYGVLTYAVWNGKVTVADFTLQFGAMLSFSAAFTAVLNGYQAIGVEAEGLTDMKKMMELPEDDYERLPEANRTDAQILPGEAVCEFQNVCYRYPGAEADAIHDFSFTFRYGKRYALIGENGAGKTTLIQLICGLLKPTAGVIKINGKDANEYSAGDRCAFVTAVFQDINMYALSLGENIALSTTVDEQKALEALNRAGYPPDRMPRGLNTKMTRVFDENGIELSGGQAQSLAIARFSYRDRAVLSILDEPTAALDPIAENDIYRQMSEIGQNSAVVFISHRLAGVHFCDEIIYLDKGHVSESGTHAELLARNGKYAEMYRVQSVYYRGENEQKEVMKDD